MSAAPETTIVPVSRPWLAVWTLSRRELVRFFRQRNRVIGAIGQPVIFWLLFGAGLGSSFRLPGGEESGVSYREFFFPGTLVLILLFTAIFATISIIEDRREGFLQSVLVAPIPRWAMVLGKVLGGSLIALLQGILFLLLALTLDLSFSPLQIVSLIGFMALVAVSLTCLGMLIAWRMDSTQGFHAIMSVFLMPMWLLSGAFFPVPAGASETWLQWGLGWVMRANPLTYAVAGMRRLLYVESPGRGLPLETPAMTTCLIVTAVSTVVLLAAATRIARRPVKGDLL